MFSLFPMTLFSSELTLTAAVKEEEAAAAVGVEVKFYLIAGCVLIEEGPYLVVVEVRRILAFWENTNSVQHYQLYLDVLVLEVVAEEAAPPVMVMFDYLKV